MPLFHFNDVYFFAHVLISDFIQLRKILMPVRLTVWAHISSGKIVCKLKHFSTLGAMLCLN